MELRHLRYFIAVADEQSFSRAAERLQIAQPPLSQQIQALEKELGVTLFDRQSRPLQLTLAGQAFLEEARSLLATLESAVQKTRRIDRGESGFLRIAFTSSIANSVFPEILLVFQRLNPDIKLILQEEKTDVLRQKLRERQTDIIFLYRYQEMVEENLKTMILAREPLVIVLPENHPLTARSTLSLSELKDEEFVMPLDNHVEFGLREQIDLLCQRAGLVPKVTQTAVFMVTILGLVAGGTGISILPASVRNLHREGVVYRSILEQALTSNLTAIWRENPSSTVLQKFLDCLNSYRQEEGKAV